MPAGSARSAISECRLSLVLILLLDAGEGDKLLGELVGIHRAQRILVLQLRGQQLQNVSKLPASCWVAVCCWPFNVWDVSMRWCHASSLQTRISRRALVGARLRLAMEAFVASLRATTAFDRLRVCALEAPPPSPCPFLTF